MLMSAKSEIADLQEEHQRETESLLENVRNATKEDKYLQLTIDNYIPRYFQDVIAQNCIWNDEIGEWQLRYVPYTGNNMRKLSPSPKKDGGGGDNLDLSGVYLSYQQQFPGAGGPAGGEGGSGTPKARGKSGRAKSGRPKTGKKKSKVITSEDIIQSTMEEEDLYPIVQKSMTGLKLF